ncbi:MAG: DUF1189 family protein [Candidatus Omnitrophota bacterium]
MNNLISFWLAPVTALFRPCVYRDAAKKSGGRGALYILYLSGVAGVLTAILMFGLITPVAHEFIVWTQHNLPVVIWTPEGISLENGQTTALMVHPKYGPIVAFDMTKTDVTEADMEKAPMLVTATKAFFRQGPGQLIEGKDITKTGIRTDKQLPAKVRITGEVAGRVLEIIKNSVFFLAPPTIAVLFFFFLLVSNLLYSLVGLLFNLMRKQKLRYGAIFSLTCFATTVSFTLTWLQIMTPFRKLPLPFVVLLLLNLVYMFIAFKVSDSEGVEAGV